MYDSCTVLLLTASFAISFCSAAYSQSAPSVEDIKGEIDRTRRDSEDPFAKSVQKNFGITVDDWIILPELSIGALFDDNVFASHFIRGGWGVDIQPAVVMKRNTGIHNTTLSLAGDISRFFDVPQADTFSGSADLKHVYEIERGFTLTYSGEIARRQDQAGTYGVTETASGATPVVVKPIGYTTYSSALDIDRNFNDAFLAAGASLQAFNYDNAQTLTGASLPETARDLVEYSGHVRAGLRFLSDAYVFVQPSITRYDYRNSGPATGYTLTSGIGTDRLSLFRGEFYGGYQIVSSAGAASGNGDLSGATFGGRVSWTPITDLVATLIADQAVTPSTVVAGATGYLTRSDTLALTVSYIFASRISVDASATYSYVNYSSSARNDKILQFGFDGTYYFTDALGLRLETSFTNVSSSQPIFDYARNRIILALHIRL
jgi:hypothetical protein